MHNRTRWLMALIAAPALLAPAALTAAPPRWELVWADEFDGTKLDRSKWRPEVSCWGGGNNERQCYTRRGQNVRVRDGMLHLIARKERFTGPDRPPEIAMKPNPTRRQDYTSGKIRSLGLASWKYGKVEFRAKPPKGQGTWPAVWMMPSENYYGQWPLSGEIDVLEGVNLGAACPACEGMVGENRMNSALHFGALAPGNLSHVTHVSLPSLALPSDDFHVWRLEWGEGLLRFFLDGRQYWEISANDWSTASPRAGHNAAAPFDQPFYIMANLAIGGKFAEENNDKGVGKGSIPAELVIDWIRVYQCGDDHDKGLSCMRSGEGAN